MGMDIHTCEIGDEFLESAFFNDVLQLRDASLPTVVCLAGCARTATTCKNRKDQCTKKFAIVVIERTIDEDVLAERVGRGGHGIIW